MRAVGSAAVARPSYAPQGMMRCPECNAIIPKVCGCRRDRLCEACRGRTSRVSMVNECKVVKSANPPSNRLKTALNGVPERPKAGGIVLDSYFTPVGAIDKMECEVCGRLFFRSHNSGNRLCKACREKG